MSEIQEKAEEVILVLNNKYPKFSYFFELSDHENLTMHHEDYKGYDSFRTSFGQKVDNLILEVKKSALSKDIEKDYLKLLTKELSNTINTYVFKKVRKTEFYYLPETSIIVMDGELRNHYKIENEGLDDYYFKQIVKVSQFKYDCTSKLIKELNQILHNNNFKVEKEKELNITELDEKIEEITKVLYDKYPTYVYQLDGVYHDIYDDVYVLFYKSYHGSHDFKNGLARKIDELILYLKKQKRLNKISNSQLQEIIDELEKSTNSFKLIKIRDKEFQFQSEANLHFIDFEKDDYLTIEDTSEDFFNELVKISQLKYDYTIKLINELKDVLKIEVQEKSEETELNIDEFFDLIFDNTPQFKGFDKVEYDWNKNISDISLLIEYQNFKNSADYHSTMQKLARKVLTYFRKEYLKNNINGKYIEGFLYDLKFQKGNFEMRVLKGNEYLCHKNAYYHSFLSDTDEEKKEYQLEELTNSWFIKEIKQYNQYHQDIIVYLINGFEKILDIEGQKKEENALNEISKLEMNLPVASIALLYRLLDEEKLLKYKKKTDIYRFISSAIKSANQENISEASLSNKFYSPDISTIQNIDAILVNLRQQLKKIKEN